MAGFVKAYNDLQASVTNLTKYDVANKKAAVLTGDSAPRIAQSQLRAIMGASLTANGLSLTSLSQVGVAFKADGTLGLDTGKLDAAIANDASGVARLFAAVGTATDSLVGVASTGAKAVPGSYAVNVTQLATRGNAVGSVAAGLTISAGVNDVLSVTIDGVAADVTLAAGTYANAAALAAEIQSKVNGATALSSAGAKVSVAEVRRRAHADFATVRLPRRPSPSPATPPQDSSARRRLRQGSMSPAPSAGSPPSAAARRCREAQAAPPKASPSPSPAAPSVLEATSSTRRASRGRSTRRSRTCSAAVGRSRPAPRASPSASRTSTTGVRR